MRRYGNLSGQSGVLAYAYGEDWIEIAFAGRRQRIYRYTYASAGQQAVERMKVLADAGLGLATYISQEVKEGYAERR